MSEVVKNGKWKEYPKNYPEEEQKDYLVWICGNDPVTGNEVSNSIFIASWYGVHQNGRCPWWFHTLSEPEGRPLSDFGNMKVLAFRDITDLYKEAWQGTGKGLDVKENKDE